MLTKWGKLLLCKYIFYFNRHVIANFLCPENINISYNFNRDFFHISNILGFKIQIQFIEVNNIYQKISIINVSIYYQNGFDICV